MYRWTKGEIIAVIIALLINLAFVAIFGYVGGGYDAGMGGG